MSELLIAARDLPSGYMRGDVITVQDDNHEWGNDESLPNFVVVKIVGVPKETFKESMKALVDVAMPGDAEFDAPEVVDRIILRHRRKQRFSLDELPVQKRAELGSSGVTTIRFSSARPVLRKLRYDRTNSRVEHTQVRAI